MERACFLPGPLPPCFFVFFSLVLGSLSRMTFSFTGAQSFWAVMNMLLLLERRLMMAEGVAAGRSGTGAATLLAPVSSLRDNEEVARRLPGSKSKLAEPL